MRRAIILLATAGLARADTKVVEDPTLLEQMLKDEQLVKRFGTVGSPRADEIELDLACADGTTVDLGFAYQQSTVTGGTWTARMQAPIELRANTNSIGTRVIVWPTADDARDAWLPLGAIVESYAHSDGTYSVSAQVQLYGFTAATISQRLPGTVTHSLSFGYQVASSMNLITANDLGIELESDQYVRAQIAPSVLAGGLIIAEAASTGIQVRTLLSALPATRLDVEFNSNCDARHQHCDRRRIPYDLDIGRYGYGSRVQMLPRSDGSWVADVSASAWTKNTMAMTRNDDEPAQVLWPMNHAKDVEFGCKLDPKFTPKGALDPKP